MATPKPALIAQTTWDYLLKFTRIHEHPVLHMYNNRTAENQRQDVTCGIGFLLPNRDSATTPDFKSMFFDPATDQEPTEDQLRADWDAAAKLLRRGWSPKEAGNLESTPPGDGYADVCKMRMRSERLDDKMSTILIGKINVEVPKNLADEIFYTIPAQAQIALMSFFYGSSLTIFTNLRKAVEERDFIKAAKECHIKGAAQQKNKSHEQLFLNAASIWKAVADGDDDELFLKLPQNFNPPEIMVFSYQVVNKP